MNFFNLTNETEEQIYGAIAKLIVEKIVDVPWSKAVLHAVIEKDGQGIVYGGYQTAETGEAIHRFEEDYRMYAAFAELRRRLSRDGQEAWSMAQFTLLPDGEFDLSFSYRDSRHPN